MLYAIEECHFEVVKLFRQHIFRKKCEQKGQKEQDSGAKRSLRETSLLKAQEESLQQRTPPSKKSLRQEHETANSETLGGTPNRLYYNYDVTSPYYINITHRRHRPQPSYPPTALNEQETSHPDKETKDIEYVTIKRLQC